jgi:hypothetical protein
MAKIERKKIEYGPRAKAKDLYLGLKNFKIQYLMLIYLSEAGLKCLHLRPVRGRPE